MSTSRTVVVRTVLRDAPGALGQLATALGARGVDIRTVSVGPDSVGRVIDELALALPEGLEPRDLEEVLLEAGALEVEVAGDEQGEGVDDIAAVGLRLAANLVRSGTVEETLAHTVRLLARADDAWVVPLPEEPPTELLAQAGRTRIPVSEHGDSVRSRSRDADSGAPWVLSVPSPPSSESPRLAVALRTSAAFSSAEIERVRALLSLLDAVEATGALPEAEAGAEQPPTAPVGERVLLPDGAPVTVRPVRGDDALGILRMHARCSERTLQRRFFSPLPSMPMRKLRWFTSTDPGSHLGVVAVLDGEIAGIAQLVATPAGDEAELGMLVEDALQRRGLGRVLLGHLIEVGRAAGYRRLVAELVADNVPMSSLLRSTGLEARSHYTGGGAGVHVEVDLWEPAEGAWGGVGLSPDWRRSG